MRDMSSRLSSDKIKAEAANLGFIACGIAKAEPVDAVTAAAYMDWIGRNRHASMAYLSNNMDKRLNPTLLMEGAKSIICVALSYVPVTRLPENEPQISVYALGKDYHDVMRERLSQLAERLGLVPYRYNKEETTAADNIENVCREGCACRDTASKDNSACNSAAPETDSVLCDTAPVTYRAFCDTAPVLERYWAERSGIGWIGKSHLLVTRKAGSMVFLGELMVDAELEYDNPHDNMCGNCHACIDNCPTAAIWQETSDTTSFDSHRCISYQTIENRGDIDADVAAKLGRCIYGCDECQRHCPWNRQAQPTTVAEFLPSDHLLGMTEEKWRHLTTDQYRALFKGSAVKRAKYEGLMRNISAVLTNKENNNGDNKD